MKIIADPLYNYVEIPDELIKILDSEEVQRLRRIKQLGLSFLVYPSANHTRFEHSLGVMHLSMLLAEKLKLDKIFYGLCGLLHDIGHGPFSHASEEILKIVTGLSHEEITKEKIKDMKDIISELGYNYKEIIKGIESELISGDIGTDRLDYIMRDAYFTGSSSNIINIFYLINNMVILNGEICIKEKALPSVENFLIDRCDMYRTVYTHKTTVAACLLLHRAIIDILEEFKPEEIYKMDDYELVKVLRERKNTYWEKIEKRELPKLAFSCDIRKFEEYNFKIKCEIEEELEYKLNCEVFVWPYEKRKPKIPENLIILTKNGKKLFKEISNVIYHLINAEILAYNFRVYVDRKKYKEEYEKIIKEFIESYLNI